MEFITVEQFKEQPVEVQKVFLDWWQPNKGDIYCNLYNNQQDNVLVINDCQLDIFKSFKDDIKLYGIPLMTEGQLRKFIEDKTDGIVKLIQWHIHDSQVSKHGYAIDILRKNEYHVTYHYKDLGENLLQAYWEVACEIAKDLFRVKYIKPYDNKS